jgi:hypothetical protein
MVCSAIVNRFQPPTDWHMRHVARTLVGGRRNRLLISSFLGATLATTRDRCAQRRDQQHYKNELSRVSQVLPPRYSDVNLAAVRRSWP